VRYLKKNGNEIILMRQCVASRSFNTTHAWNICSFESHFDLMLIFEIRWYTQAYDGMVAQPLVVISCLLLLFLSIFSHFCWVFTWLRLLPTTVNKISENSKDYIIILAKIRWKGHVKYDKLSPNKYLHTYLLLLLEQNKRKTNLRT